MKGRNGKSGLVGFATAILILIILYIIWKAFMQAVGKVS